MPPSSPPLLTCSVCQTTLDPNGTCPRCRAPEDWNDQIEALDFVLRRLEEWHEKGHLKKTQIEAFAAMYEKRRQVMTTASGSRQTFQADATFPRRDVCWNCREYLYTNSSHCHECGAPITDPGVRSLRYLNYLCRELQRGEESGMLTLRQAHELIGDVNERIAALQGKLERERAPMVMPVDEESQQRRKSDGEQPLVVHGPRRTVLEILLDPQSIQWLLAAGGALTVLGLVIWLTAIGLFERPGYVAAALGMGNAALLGGGWFLILRTRYQNAGRALTLLACLVMPLNLWFYHTHDLITLDRHLWIAALVCCAVYAASAWLLKDAIFVYVLVGGITLTGLLLLAEQQYFWEIFAPTAFLIVVGLICLHAERAFPDIDSPFSRRRFGMAFFWSSHALIGCGLLLMLGAQLLGCLPDAIRQVVRAEIPDVAKREALPWTLLLVLAGIYAYVYSDLVVRRIGVYLYFAAITLLWAEILVLILVNVPKTETIIIITLALTALAINVLQDQFKSQYEFLRRVSPLGILLSLIPVLFGVLLHFRAVNSVLHEVWPFEIDWSYVAAMAVTAISCRAGAYLYRHTFNQVAVVYFFATAAATLVFAAGLAWMIGLKPWETEAPLLMLIPILYLVASYFYRGHTPENPLVWAAHAATAVMLICSLWAALRITPQVVEPIEGQALNLLLALYCLETSVFYGVAAFLRLRNWSIYLSAVMLCGAIWQSLLYLHTPDEYYTLAFALTGFALLIVYRLGLFEKWEMAPLEQATFQSANTLTTLGFVSGALLSLSRLVLKEGDLIRMDALARGVEVGEWRNPVRILLYLLIVLTVISLLSAWLVQHKTWRRIYLILSIINAALIVLVFHRLSELKPWEKLEIIGIILGLLLLGVGYVGWYRETERASDLVSFAFLIGAFSLVIPLAVASMIYRFGLLEAERRVSMVNETSLIVACIALFASGVLCRIKATTLIGSVAMLFYIMMVIVYMHRFIDDTYLIGIYLTLGGALLFGTGLFLSMYRDRLLALPDRIRRREGLFRIFDWR
jgi:hypothetical protein